MNKRAGFTMIELLFVIVILGLVGGFALNTIRQYYEGIYRSQVYTQRVAEADHVLEQLSKYFENAIELSIVNLDEDAADGALISDCAGDPGEENESIAHDYTVGMISVDTDSLRLVGKPGWSEYATWHLETNTTGRLFYSDSNLTAANNVLTALGSSLGNSAIYDYRSSSGAIGSCSNFNWDSSGGLNGYFTITGVNGNELNVTNHNPSITDPMPPDRKYLLRTGHAFRVLDTGKFVMYTNFRPWSGELYTSGDQVTLADNVASFYADFNNTNSFNDRGSVWRLKVCMRGLDSNLTTNDKAEIAICRERRVHVRY